MKHEDGIDHKVVKDTRKTRYTKKALQESLLELMKSKSILHITIKDICALADISRSTFYTYYDNQYDLLKQIEEETFVYFAELLKKYGKKRSKQEMLKLAEEILYTIANSSLRVLLSENGDIDFQKRFISRFIHQVQMMDYVTETSGDPILGEYYSVYIVNGSSALVQHWLKNNMTIPIPHLAKILLTFPGLKKPEQITPPPPPHEAEIAIMSIHLL
ncbi:MAG: TetR/AcrR family transcriptional regulator [Treponema sp.]|jgi:ACT domain-containing protein|nr:TetR/AcrR family transcriptional regulator [Treponema sp.]